MYPLLTRPIYQKTIWAGTALDAVRGAAAEGAGSSWEVTIRSGSESVVDEGELAGTTIHQLIEEFPEMMLGKATPDDLMRVGILDAGEALSVQVHPDEAYAQANEDDHGKIESWYVVHAEPGATLVAGTDCATRDQVADTIEEGTVDMHLVRHAVADGDFAHITTGELHAIGAGIMVVEMSTNSDTTYRFYDYDRTDAAGNKRELHVEKGLAVIDPAASSDITHHPLGAPTQTESCELVSCDQYVLELVDVVGMAVMESGDTPNYLTFVSGSGTVSGGDHAVEVPFLRSVFVPACIGTYTITGECRVMRGYAK